jgi:hypothetical protein
MDIVIFEFHPEFPVKNVITFHVAIWWFFLVSYEQNARVPNTAKRSLTHD